MWDICHANASPVLGSPGMVEASAQWPGEDEVFFAALKDGGWLDEVSPGVWGAHDYWDHCPAYVTERLRKRRQREDNRRQSLAGLGDVPGLSQDIPPPVPGQSQDGPQNVVPYAEPEALAEAYPEEPQDTDRPPKAPPPPPAEAEDDAPVRYPAHFEEFWEAYPRKVGKRDALRSWVKARITNRLASKIVEAVKAQRSWAQWTKEGGRYIPNPATWLNQGRWEDERDRAGPQKDGLDEVRREQVKKLNIPTFGG